MNVLVVGSGDPAPHLARLERWNDPITTTTDVDTLFGVDLVLALPDAIDRPIVERARAAGVRVAEVVS